MASVISVKNISKIFGDVPNQTVVLTNITLDIKNGELLSIVGPSGSGKSSLMYILGLLDKPTSGDVFMSGSETGNLSEVQRARLRNQRIGFVFQTYNLLSRTSALANVMLPLQYSRVPFGERKDRALKLLDEVGLSHRISSYPSQLSGGEQQRVAIARALVCEPSIILADEPTGNLDSKNGRQILSILMGLNKKGTTVVVVTHDQKIARKTRRQITIRDGKIISDRKGL